MFEPAYSLENPPKDDLDWSTMVLADILLQPGEGNVTLLERIFSHSLPCGTLNAEPLDPLMYMLGFDEPTMPDTSFHQFSSAMGSFFERLVKTLFQFQRPNLYRDDWKTIAEELNVDCTTSGLGKRWGDFMLGTDVVEIKYRYASGQSKDDQGRCAKRLIDLGKNPVMLMLRKSKNADIMRAGGWTVYEGVDAIAWIAEHAAIDLGDLARVCRCNPLFAHILNPYQDRYDDKRCSSLLAMFTTLHADTQQNCLKILSVLLSNDAQIEATPLFKSRRTCPSPSLPPFRSIRSSSSGSPGLIGKPPISPSQD